MPSNRINRIRSLEGLRGLLAVAVFNGHIIPSLFPQVVDGSIWEGAYYTPLFFLLSAGFAVSYFFFVSGFGLCISGEEKSWWKIILNILKRYCRLVPIILLCNLLCWLLMKGGFYYIDYGDYNPQVYDLNCSILRPIKEAFWGVFRGEYSFSNPFWTIEPQFKGILYVSILLIVEKQLPIWLHVVINTVVAIVMYCLKVQATAYVISMVAGTVCYEIYIRNTPHWKRVREFAKRRKTMMYALLFLTLELIVIWFHIESLNKALNYTFFCWIPFVVLLPVILAHDNALDRVLEGRLLTWLGKLSFAFYGVHIIIRSSFGYAMILILKSDPDPIRIAVVYIIVLLITLVAAAGFTFINRLIQAKAVNPLFRCIEDGIQRLVDKGKTKETLNKSYL